MHCKALEIYLSRKKALTLIILWDSLSERIAFKTQLSIGAVPYQRACYLFLEKFKSSETLINIPQCPRK
jgi:hypothetical protein